MILETKLNLPQPKVGALLRKGLIDLIKNNLDKKLILITAGAGYGKTTLLAQLVREARLPAVFYDLDKSDSDLMVLYSYLIKGIMQIDPALVKYSEELSKQGGETGKNIELLFGTLINELHNNRKEELFVILDNYQNLAEDSLVHKALDYFIDHQPETVHVIVASRSSVRFPNYAKWFAKQDAFELTHGDLRFSEGEVRQLLAKSCGITLCDEDLKQVLAHTEGWITGIQLVLIQPRTGKPRISLKESLNGYLQAKSADCELFQYFMNDIFIQESKDVQNYLRQSSVLEMIPPDACDYMLNEAASRILLMDLERRNIFITKIGEECYKYHRLFREFLLRQIDEKESRLLRIRAAEYYQKNKLLDIAVEYYLIAGQYDKAMAIMLEIVPGMMMKTKYSILNRWMEQIPDKTLERMPWLLTEKGFLCQEKGRFNDADRLFLRAEELLWTVYKRNRRDMKTNYFLSDTLLSRAKFAWLNGEYGKAFPLLSRALRICPSSVIEIKLAALNLTGITWKLCGNLSKARKYLLMAKNIIDNNKDDILMIMIESNLAAIDLCQGRGKRAAAAFKSMYERIKGNYHRDIGVFYANAATAMLVTGDIEAAEKYLNEGWRICCPYEDIRSRVTLNGALGELYMYKDQWNLAYGCLERAIEEAEIIKWQDIEIKMLLKLAALHCYRQEITDTEKYIALAKQKVLHMDGPQGVPVQIEAVQLDLALGRFARAKQKIDKCLILTYKNEMKAEEYRLRLAKAAMLLRMKNKKAAKGILSKVIIESRLNGYDGLLRHELKRNPDLANLASVCKPVMEHPESCINIAPIAINASCDVDLKIRLFGNLQLHLADGKEVPLKWRFRKVESLFAYLLLHHDRVCNREELMNALWPRERIQASEQNLYPAVSKLKNNLRDSFRAVKNTKAAQMQLIDHKEFGYRITPSVSLWIDAVEFERHWRGAKALEKEGNRWESVKDYQKCVELYRDVLLPNIGEAWCEKCRDHYEKMYLFCLTDIASYYMDNRQYQEAMDMYYRYLLKDPCSEEIHVKYWKALKALGRKVEIAQDYRQLQKSLRKLLDEAPAAETENAFKEIMTD